MKKKCLFAPERAPHWQNEKKRKLLKDLSSGFLNLELCLDKCNRRMGQGKDGWKKLYVRKRNNGQIVA